MATLLYIPGLGSDSLIHKQRHYLKWKLPRLGWDSDNLVVFETRWHESESYQEKWQRLLVIISNLKLSETTVVGVSAGGSLLTRLLAEYPDLKSAHAVSAKLSNAKGIGQDYRDSAPALYDAVTASEKSLFNSHRFADKTTVFRLLFDNVVPLPDMLIPGARTKRNAGLTHTLGIIFYLAFSLPKH